MAQSNLPRGIRNKNPLNLRKSNNAWLGKVKNSTDQQFEQFTNIVFGYRAAIVNIRTILRRRAQKGMATTVADLVHVWAPNGDGGNNERIYVQRVLRGAGMKADEELDIRKKMQILALVYEMALVENGNNNGVQLTDIDAAYNLLYPASVHNTQESSR